MKFAITVIDVLWTWFSSQLSSGYLPLEVWRCGDERSPALRIGGAGLRTVGSGLWRLNRQ